MCISIWSLSHKPTIKTCLKCLSINVLRIFVRKTLCKLLSKHLWQILLVVKLHALSRFFQILLDNASEVWKLLFKVLDINTFLDVNTTFRMQKSYCQNFWWKHISNGNSGLLPILKNLKYPKFFSIF